MTDIFQPNPPPLFEPNAQAAPPIAEPPKNGRKGRRGPRQPKEAAAPKKPRAYSRKQKASISITPVSAPPGLLLSVPAAVAALAGTTEEDGKFIIGVVQAMDAFDVAQRKRIVAALARMFS